MPSRRLSSSSSSALASSVGQRQGSQQLDVVFTSDPLFVHAGNGVAVPRGLSGVQHDHSAAPVLNFRSDDAYATMSEISRRASAAKEMKAALKAQIAAKRTLESGAADDDDYEAQQTEHSVRTGTARSSRQSPPITRPAASMPIRSYRVHSPPQLNSAASTSSDATSNAVAARRAMAAQELKNALEAQMQAKMMLEIADDDDGEHIRGESSQLTDQLGTGSLMDYSASNLATWELQEANSSFFNDTRLPSLSQSSITNAWKDSLRTRDRRSSTPPFATDYPASPEAAPRRTSTHSAADVFARRPPRPGTTGTPSPELWTYQHGTSSTSSPPRRVSDNRSMTSSPPPGAVGSNPNIGASTQQPALRFRSDNHFETSQEIEARADKQNRQRDALDAQIAEKQARLEAEQAEVSTRRSPLAHQASGTKPPSATHALPAAGRSMTGATSTAARMDSMHTDGSRFSSSHNGWTSTPPVHATRDGSPAQSTAGSAHTHSARENVAPDDSDLIHASGPYAKENIDSNRSPLEPTQHQPLPGATPSSDLPPATAPTPITHQAPAQDGVVQLTPEAQRAKDQEEVYRAWQRAHEEAGQEKRRRTRRHAEIAAQEKREKEERAAAERAAAERAAEEEFEAAERAAAEKVAAEAAAEEQLQRMQAVSTPAGGTPTGGSSGSGTQQQASGTPAGAHSTSAVVPTASLEEKVDSKLQPPAVATDAVKPRRGFFSCCMCSA